MGSVKYLSVAEAESGQKVVQFLSRRLGGQIPRSALMRWVRTGQVRVDSSRVKPFQRLSAGQRVRIPPYSPEEGGISKAGERKGNPFTLGRVYEDEQLLVVLKPPGLPSQPGKSTRQSVATMIRSEYAGREWTPTLVHRLDRETSGLLLLAKSYPTLRFLQEQMSQNRMRKIYLAWVQGETDWWKWTRLQDRLRESRDSEEKEVKAVSWVRTLRHTQGNSLVAVALKTGRRHQIRIQLADRGRPVAGDRKYGTGSSTQGLKLHAYLLSWQDRCFTRMPHWRGRFRVSEQDLQDV